MTCPYLHKLCPKPNCTNHVCRAFFPERQPNIKDDTLSMCMGDEYAENCPQYDAGTQFREERKQKKLNLHCPFASNTVCGKPDEWWCKGGVTPHKLYPVKDEGGEILYTKEQLKETCWSGKQEVYDECPAYIDGVAFREHVNQLKKEKTPYSIE